MGIGEECTCGKGGDRCGDDDVRARRGLRISGVPWIECSGSWRCCFSQSSARPGKQYELW